MGKTFSVPSLLFHSVFWEWLSRQGQTMGSMQSVLQHLPLSLGVLVWGKAARLCVLHIWGKSPLASIPMAVIPPHNHPFLLCLFICTSSGTFTELPGDLCHSQWEHAPGSSTQLWLAQEHHWFLQCGREEGRDSHLNRYDPKLGIWHWALCNG